MSCVIKSLSLLEERVSPECFQDILDLTEGLFKNDGRGDLFDDISRLFTGKSVKDHVKSGVKKLCNGAKDKVKSKILKSKMVRDSIGKKELEKTEKELDRAQLDHNYYKTAHRSCDDPSYKRVYREDAKAADKEANKKAKRVSEIKRKYGFNS